MARLGNRLLPALAALALLSPATGSAGTPTLNPIQRENIVPGTRDWEIGDPALDHEIEGYASRTSVGHDESIEFFVNVKPVTAGELPPDYTIQIFRVGWYRGIGGRAMTGPIRLRGVVQPAPSVDPSTRLVECDWVPSHELRVPGGWVTGVYLAKLTELARHKSAYIIFVVRNDRRATPLLFQVSVTTYQAYNGWGGHSLYEFTSVGEQEAREVSFDRPYAFFYSASDPDRAINQPQRSVGAGDFFGWEVNMLRYLEREGYDVGYATNVDTHEDPGLLLRHRALLSVGHDEYWSLAMRRNVEGALASGVSLASFGGNPVYWRIRLEPSRISGAPNRTIVSYKEDACGVEDAWDGQIDPLALDGDPSNDDLVTSLWGDSSDLPGGGPACQEPRHEAELVGVGYFDSPVDSYIRVKNTGHWAFAGTGLRDGDTLPGLLGYEVDRLWPESPTNIIVLGESDGLPPSATDNPPGEASHMTLYTLPSGALVFATGSMQWTWGLDDYNPDGAEDVCCNRRNDLPKSARTLATSGAVRRITRNVLEEMTR